MVTALLVATFLNPFMGSSLVVALPDMAENLHVDAVLLTWVTGAYILASGVAMLPLGRLVDLLGARGVFLWGLLGVGLSSVVVALAPNLEVVLLFRAIQGAASAMLFASSMPLMMGLYPPAQRGMALGMVTGVVYLALSLGPVLGGLLTSFGGWRLVVAFSIPCAALALFLAWRSLPHSPRREGGVFMDPWGAFAYAGAVLGIVLSLSFLPKVAGFVLLGLGVFSLAGFVWWEKRAPNPLLDMRLFTENRRFAFSNLAAFVNYAATFTVGFLVSLYLQYIKGFSPREAGLVLIAQPVLQAALSPWMGKLSDRIDPGRLASIGMLLTTLCLASFAAGLSPETSLIALLFVLGLLGVSFAVFSSPNANAVMGAVAKSHQGIASGMLGTMRLTGQMLGMGLVTLLFSIKIGAHKITPEFYPAFLDSVRWAFGLFAALCLVGALFSLARGRVNGGEKC